jgi:putative transposase
MNEKDFIRFLKSMDEFNVVEPTGGIYANSFNKEQKKEKLRNSVSGPDENLVNIICYCLNPNHYHIVLEQLVDDGIVKFMHRLGTGYTKNFNTKYNRVGSLFQGKYKAVHINSNNYLLHVSAYVNLNDKVHRLRSSASKSSWEEHVKGKGYGNGDIVCGNKIVLDQFKSRGEYKKFAEESLKKIQDIKDMKKMLLD